MDSEQHGTGASIEKRYAHMLRMIPSCSKRINTSRMNASKSEKQGDMKRAKIPERRREIMGGKNRMSWGHGR